MDIEKIKSLAKHGESTTLEFKASTSKLQAAFESICAFLNGKGGTVLIGVNDKGSLIGQDVTDNTRREIAREVKKIEPTPPVDTYYTEIKENKFVITIHVNAGDHAPYVYDGRAYQRNESQTDRMSQHRYEQLLVKRSQINHSWEEVIASGYTLDDLDHEEIYKTVSDGIRENRIPASAQREDVEHILERLGLLTGNELKRAAVVLYAKQESM
jgi:ATP-dependent DNA helicase RecG